VTAAQRWVLGFVYVPALVIVLRRPSVASS
jgi:hypothetical protein